LKEEKSAEIIFFTDLSNSSIFLAPGCAFTFTSTRVCPALSSALSQKYIATTIVFFFLLRLLHFNDYFFSEFRHGSVALWTLLLLLVQIQTYICMFVSQELLTMLLEYICALHGQERERERKLVKTEKESRTGRETL